MNLSRTKIKSPIFISTLIFLVIIIIAIVFIPKSNWKKILCGQYNNLATAFQTNQDWTSSASGDWNSFDTWSSSDKMTSLNSPEDIVISLSGYIYISDMGNNRIVVLNPDGKVSATYDNSDASYPYPGFMARGLALSTSDDIYIVDTGGGRIIVLNPDGTASTFYNNSDATYPTPGLNNPTSLAFSPSGEIYITDNLNSRIVVLNPDGSASTTYNNLDATYPTPGLNYPLGIALSISGDIYIADRNNNRIVVLNPDGSASTTYNNLDATYPTPGLNNPFGITLSSSGEIYISDMTNNRIVVLNPEGSASTTYNNSDATYPTPGLNSPTSLAFSPSGEIYITDNDNNRIVVFNSDGTASTTYGPNLLVVNYTPVAGIDYPGINNDVTINSGTVTLSNDQDVRDLILAPGGTLDLGNSTLNIYGHWWNFINTGGTLLVSDGKINLPSINTDIDTNIEINTGTVTLTQDQNIHNLTLAPGGTLDLAGYTLNVSGDWNNTGGTLINNGGKIINLASQTWKEVSNNSSFQPRWGQTNLFFKNKLWIISGSIDPTSPYNNINDVWSSVDGNSWEVATDSAEFPGVFAAGSVVFDNKMWIMGGLASDEYNDAIWNSSDGITWNLVTNTQPFSLGWYVRVLSYDNKIWILDNGTSGTWNSPDGINWTQITEASPVGSIGMADSYGVYNDSIYIIKANGDTYSTTDWINWTDHGKNNMPSQALTTDKKFYTINDRNYIVDNTPTEDGTLYQPELYWSDDLVNWFVDQQIQIAVNAFPTDTSGGRIYPSYLGTEDGIWFIGGVDNQNKIFNDIWYSGSNLISPPPTSLPGWILKTSHAPWSARNGHSMLYYDNKVWLIGGGPGPGNGNSDVWSTVNGSDWINVTNNAAFCKIYGPASYVFDGKMWIAGGMFNLSCDPTSIDGISKKVYYSTDGADWTLATDSAAFGGSFTGVNGLVYDNKMWFFDNLDNSIYSSSDGITWELVTDSNPTPTTGLNLAVFNGKMWQYRHDSPDSHTAYSSTNGINWTEEGLSTFNDRGFGGIGQEFGGKLFMAGATSTGEIIYVSTDGINWGSGQSIVGTYNGRYYGSLVSSPSGLWFSGGSYDNKNYNDVWYTNPSLITTSATRRSFKSQIPTPIPEVSATATATTTATTTVVKKTKEEVASTTLEVSTTTPEVVSRVRKQTPVVEEKNSNIPENTGTSEATGISTTTATTTIVEVIASTTKSTSNDIVSNIGDSIKQTYEQLAVSGVQSIQIAKDIVESPTGSVVTKTISTVGVVAGAGASVAAVAFATPISFTEIFLIPARLFGLLMGALGIRRKQREWGTVYDSVTKRPLDPVYVSLIDTETNKEAASAITDIDGRYGFLVLPGKYKIVVKKTNYISPSIIMKGKLFDEVYNDLYFGEDITITEEGQIISKNIPMDSMSFDWNEFAKTKMNVNTFMKGKDVVWAKISNYLFAIGATVSLITVIFAPAPYNIIVAGFYILAYILNYIVFQSKKSGTLTEKNTKSPLSFAIVKIFREGETIPLVKKIADKFGSYYALLPNGKYYIKIDKKNDDGSYTEVFQSSTLDITKGVINFDLKV